MISKFICDPKHVHLDGTHWVPYYFKDNMECYFVQEI